MFLSRHLNRVRTENPIINLSILRLLDDALFNLIPVLIPGHGAWPSLIEQARHSEDNVKPVVKGDILPHPLCDSSIGDWKDKIIPIYKKDIPVTRCPEDIHRLFVGSVIAALIADAEVEE